MIQWDPRALDVLARLRKAGYQAVLVGGCVRDFLRGREPHDYDAATSARPEEILAACADLPCIPTGLRHGTVTVLSQGLPVEVTAFRREGRYSDGRHPDQVSFTTSLEEDLARRDFTINAMAWDEGGLVDCFGGRADLETGLIRCVGEPERRFQEDALRILRGLRLASQLDFAIHHDTAHAIRRETPRLSMVARERIGGEFLRLLCGPGVGRVLLDFPQTVCEMVPQLAPAVGFDHLNKTVPQGTLLAQILSPLTLEVIEEIVAPCEQTVFLNMRGYATKVHPGDYAYILGDLASAEQFHN